MRTKDCSILLTKKNQLELEDKDKHKGILIAFAIFGLWTTTIVTLLTLDISKIPFWGVVIAILWQTFLYTGLFITAHDAMHGLVYPHNQEINHLIGLIAISFYALLPYQTLVQKHRLHHCYPASYLDPDFHNGKQHNFCSWYLHFMQGYWNWTRLTILLTFFGLLSYLTNISLLNLILFWILPSILSSLQLFYFGTFLPHRQPPEGYKNNYRTQSIELPIFLSFITCYHFGYHLQHHQYPNIPWWKLPKLRSKK